MGWRCGSCGRRYAYEVPTCTFCGVALEHHEIAEATVEAVTEVGTPSTGHEDVPYWTALVCDAMGERAILKFDHAVTVGQTVALLRSPETLERVGVVGSGVMGKSLAELLLGRGHEVVWVARSEERLAGARATVLDRLARVLDDAQLETATRALVTSTSYESLGDCPVIIEAVAEDLSTKLEVLRALELHAAPEAVIATNTSGIPLDDLATVLKNPHRFGGLHFFNPATRMRLVETAVSSATDAQTSAYLDEFAQRLGKVPVRVASAPGFVVNRVLMPLLNEAVRTLEEGVAGPEAIDEAVRLGLNHPMGPLALADLIGLDVVVEIMDNLTARTGDSAYDPRPALRKLVEEGRLGRKSGAGFYEYES